MVLHIWGFFQLSEWRNESLKWCFLCSFLSCSFKLNARHAGENSAYGLVLCLMASTAQSAAGGHQLRNQLRADFANTSFQSEMVIVASDVFPGGLNWGSVPAPLGAVGWDYRWMQCGSHGFLALGTLSISLLLRSPGGVWSAWCFCGPEEFLFACSSNGAALLWSVPCPLV